MSHWPLSLWVNFIILRVEFNGLYVYEYYMLWVDLTRLCVIFILLYVFVMYNFCTMNVHISICFCHAQLCTNDFQYYYRFSECTSLYEWLSIFFWIFGMHISVRMTSNIILAWVLVMNIFVRLTIHIILEWVFVMHIFVRMTINIILVWVFVMHTFLYEWLFILFLYGFRHAHLSTNDYPYSYWFLSCTSFYEWLSKLLL